LNLQNLKYLSEENFTLYKNLFMSINSKITNLVVKLQFIENLNLDDNLVYVQSFNFLKTDINEILYKIEDHLEQLYVIRKEEATILKALDIINEIFPDVGLLTTNNLPNNQYREYIFPYKFVDILIGNFSSELHYRNRNDIVFSNKLIKRHRMYRVEYSPRTGINVINYISFINKILSIAQFGYSLSNNKSVNVASTIKINRNF